MAFLNADFEFKKDVNANFAYYMAFAEANQAYHLFDPNGDISAIVGEFAAYVQGNPPDPRFLLEIADLAKLGVDLSFFPDLGHIISLTGSDAGEATKPVGGETRVVPPRIEVAAAVDGTTS